MTTDIEEIKRALAKSEERVVDLEAEIDDLRMDLRDAEERADALRDQLAKATESLRPSCMADVLTIAGARGPDLFGCVAAGERAVTNGHGMLVTAADIAVPANTERVLSETMVAKVESDRDAVSAAFSGMLTVAQLEAACALGPDEPEAGDEMRKVRVRGVLIDPRVLRIWALNPALAAGDQSVDVVLMGVMKPLFFRGSNWRSVLMPLRDDGEQAPERLAA